MANHSTLFFFSQFLFLYHMNLLSPGVEPADSFCPMSDVNKPAQSSGLESSWPEQTQQVGSLLVGAKLQENDSSDGSASVQNSGDADGNIYIAIIFSLFFVFFLKYVLQVLCVSVISFIECGV